MSSSVQFGKTAFVEAVATLEGIVAKLRAIRGNASARKAEAVWTALGQPADLSGAPSLADFGDGITLGDVAVWVSSVQDWAAQQTEEAATVVLKESAVSEDEQSALKEAYATQRGMVDAMAMLLKAQGIDVSDVTVPALRASSGSGSGRKVSTAGQQFYRIVDGVRKDQSSGQNNVSSFAFYHSAKMTGTKMGSPDFQAWLKAQGIESMAKPWTLVIDGITYGLDIIGDTHDATPAEADDADGGDTDAE